jgi:hypothetical protein
MLEVLDTVKWWSDAADQPPEVRILLNVRLIETVCGKIGNGKWYEYLDEYYKLHWIWQTLKNDLNPVLRIVGSYRAYSEPQYSILSSWLLRIRRDSKGPRYTIYFDEAYRALDDVATVVTSDTLDGRDIRSLKKYWESLESVTQRVTGYAEEWSFLKERLIRLRNALTHGGPFIQASAESVVDFSAAISAWAVSFTIEAALTGRSVKDVHDHHQAGIKKRMDKLHSASSVSDALFDN